MVTPNETVFYGGCLSGGMSGGPCPAIDSWAYVDSQKWRRMQECPSARMFSGMAPWPFKSRYVVMFGGQEKRLSLISNKEALRNEIDVLNVATGQWSRFQSRGDPTHGIPTWRVGLHLINTRNSVLLYGGEPSNDAYVWELTGTIEGSSSAGECGPVWFAWPHLHGLFMIISWGFLLPLGVFIARYFKHKDPLWFTLHQRFQVSGAVISFIGIFLVLPGTLAVPNFAHSVIGVLIFLWTIQQIVNGFRRPHKNPPSKKREHWEIWHKWGGRTFLVLSLINIFLGLFLVMAPTAVIAVWSAVFAVIVCAFAAFELKLRYFATDLTLDEKKHHLK